MNSRAQRPTDDVPYRKLITSLFLQANADWFSGEEHREEISKFLESDWCAELLEFIGMPTANPHLLISKRISR